MKRRALFIGINEYNRGLPELSCAKNDATELCEFFESCGYATEIIRDADTDKILTAIGEKTCDLKRDDLFLFFFAGHGYTVENKEDHSLDRRLAGQTDRWERIQNNQDGVRLAEIRGKVADARCSCVAILDACQSTVNSKRGGLAGREACTKRDLLAIESALQSGVRTSDSGSFVVINSCQEGDVAYELTEEGHGLFTLSLLDILRRMKSSGENAIFDSTFAARIAGQMLLRSHGRFRQQPKFFADRYSQNRFSIFPTAVEGDAKRSGYAEEQMRMAAIRAKEEQLKREELKIREEKIQQEKRLLEAQNRIESERLRQTSSESPQVSVQRDNVAQSIREHSAVSTSSSKKQYHSFYGFKRTMERCMEDYRHARRFGMWWKVMPIIKGFFSGLMWDWGSATTPWFLRPAFIILMILFGVCLSLLLYWRHLLEIG